MSAAVPFVTRRNPVRDRAARQCAADPATPGQLTVRALLHRLIGVPPGAVSSVG